ncbi:HAD-IA family hydrolase [Marinactinospora thermotolerans]|uniref:Sugar-phosphatase n=1 Tax=Marinactinospora thermotolerans DSM 45154 TaxID=1122192 RepID=A0A1T4PW20_9ACTN|nr:HAD-IA family hydrolase [Marinactinospora thermotolerans]SJZ95497.1 sugar-phosphatase [Marinactinospora thermotolerans DSM 45154]
MMIPAEALLFDMDGTLIDSTPAAVRCWLRWAEEWGVSPRRLAEVHMHGRPAADIVAELVEPGRVAAAVARIDELEIAETDGLVMLPGTAELLESLPRERWAVVTSATRALAEARLKAVGIEAPLVVTADDITRGKPDPEPFVVGARSLGVAASRCVVFEDAPVGVAAGRAAGARVVAVTTTHGARELAADVVVADLSAVSVVEADGALAVRAGAREAR